MLNSTVWRLALVVILTALGVFVVFTVFGVGDGARPAKRAPYVLTPLALYTENTPHVLSTLTINSVQGAVSGAPQTPPSELHRCPHPRLGSRSPNIAPTPSSSSV